MLSYDFDIIKEQQDYFLIYKDKKVFCSDSNDFVKERNQKLIQFIIEDFDRCGKIKLDKDNRIKTNNIHCAYHIFSVQKLFIENKKNYDDIISMLLKFSIHDFSLIQVANGPPEEHEEISRLLPVRNAIGKVIGEQNFNKLTDYAWGCYYFNNFQTIEGPGKYISDEEYSKSNLAKTILELFLNNSDNEKASILSLFHAIGQKSILLPISLIKGWMSKSEFVSASMILGGGILDLSGMGGTTKSHQHSYKYHESIASLCINYSSLDLESYHLHKIENDKTEKSIHLHRIKNGETKKVEFKESLSWDKKKNTKEKYIEDAIIKTVAGFLNSDGGELFVGVDDNGSVVGITEEIEKFYKSKDKMLLHFRNVIKKNLDESLIVFINYEILEISNNLIFYVNCKKSDREVFVKSDLWVRTGPSTDKLEGQQMIDYIRRNFGEK